MASGPPASGSTRCRNRKGSKSGREVRVTSTTFLVALVNPDASMIGEDRGEEGQGSQALLDLFAMARGTVSERRLRRVRDLRQGLVISVAFVLVGVFAGTAGAAWLGGWAIFVAFIPFIIGLFGLAISLSQLNAESGIEGDVMYGARLPVACLWNRTRLGAFRASDIVTVEITKMQGYSRTAARSLSRGPWSANTFLIVRPKSAPAARFLLSASYARILLSPSFPLTVGQAYDDARRAMDWLRDHGVPVGRMDAASDRRSSIGTARRTLAAGAVGIALTVVAEVVVGPTARGPTALLIALPAALALIGLGAFFISLGDGSRVSEAGVFSYRIPLRALWNSSELGLIGPDQVASAKIEAKKARQSRTVGPARLLTIRARLDGSARFNSEDDPEAFQAAVDWLGTHLIPVDDLTRG